LSELTIYDLSQNMLSLVILIILIAIWLNKFKSTTCLTLLSSLFVLLLGATTIFVYPSGVFACDVFEIHYWIP